MMGLQWTISPNEYAVGFLSVPTTDFKPNMEGEIVPISLPRRTCSQQLRPGWATILTLISVFVAVACATQEPLPTYTPMPTHTPYPTLGALPTHTPFPTWRPFPHRNPNACSDIHALGDTHCNPKAHTRACFHCGNIVHRRVQPGYPIGGIHRNPDSNW